MPETLSVNVRHITRVEGHGNILLNVKNGTIEKIEWQVPEAPRFFEAMVRGRSWQDIQTIVSRICGICSVTHSLAALKAIEAAMNIPVSRQTVLLRELILYMEHIESHVLHVGYLVAPDLLGEKSVLPLASSHPSLVKTIIALHRLGNEGMELLGGRATHPVTLKPGGFSSFPPEKELQALQNKLKASVPQFQQVVEAVLSLAGKIPDFKRQTEYVALVDSLSYALYDGHIGSSDAAELTLASEFEKVVNEYVSPQSTAKWCKWHRDSYAVGALARFNLNAPMLKPLAGKTAAAFGLEQGACNPYLNSVAQLVEVAHVVEHSVEIIDNLLSTGVKNEKSHARPKAGEGAGAVEAPRGVLFHRYAFDQNGNCTKANLCIPTNQNHANIQKDFEALVPQIIDRPPEQIRLLLEMLVRAYDPCVSCSTHCLNVEFV